MIMMEVGIVDVFALILIGAIVLWGILQYKERRCVVNAFVFLIAVGSFLLLMIYFGDRFDSQVLKSLGYGFSFLLLISIPIAYVGGTILMFTTGIKLIRLEGFSLSHALSLLFGFGVVVSTLFLPFFITNSNSPILTGIFGFIFSFYNYFVLGFVLYFFATLVYGIHFGRKDQDYLIVLGSGLNKDRVTPLLAGRIDRAIAYGEKQCRQTGKTPTLVMSGGQGADERIPEAVAMKEYALSKGFPEEQILIEDQSTTTEENLIFSTEVIKAHTDVVAPKILFVTTNYHVFRAALISRALGLDYNGIGSPTKFYFYVSALIREYIAVMVAHKKLHIMVAAFMGFIFFFSVHFN